MANTLPTDFSDIKTREELAKFLGIPLQRLTMLAFASGIKRYIRQEAPKKNGGIRVISAPRGDLKAVQRKIGEGLSEKYSVLPCVQGFVGGRSVATNAHEHIRKKFLLSLDLKDFFPSISSGRVHELFLKFFRFPSEVTDILTNLVCDSGCLPQGAPTSPIISNIICYKMDRALLSFAAANKIEYTRYADDLTFSTTSAYVALKLFDNSKAGLDAINPKILSVVRTNYFQINEKKIHAVWRGSRQLVNGIVVNDKCNMPRSTYRSLRALFNTWRKDGYEVALTKYLTASPIYKRRLITDGKPCQETSFAQHIRGRLQYLTMVITVDGHTSSPLEKLWTMYYDQTHENVPFVTFNRYALQLESCYDTELGEPEVTMGSGFCCGPYLITCDHCIPEENVTQNIDIRNKDKKWICSVCSDSFKRLPLFDLAYAPLSDDKIVRVSRFNLKYLPQPGENITAVGYSGGERLHAVTTSIVGSGLADNTVKVDRAFIQGMSGGPVFNSRSELIGVVARGSAEDAYTRDGEFIPLNQMAEFDLFKFQQSR
uniref:reverse transcriptase domain-containing protein n=1 Tax=Olsenella uli TaxID=133926 RepID=UPI0028E5F545|nr:reverse transcriptase domain-containing protein [Olsenella uli]